MSKNLKAYIQNRLEAVVRQLMVRCLSGYLPLYIVNEYPKSGGTWLGQMLSEAMLIPFPRNRMPEMTASIMHDHYYHPWGLDHVVVLFRDGRDVMVSWYHHCLFYNERSNARLVDIVRADLPFEDYENVAENLPQFIEYAFTRQKHPNFSWAEFVRRWHARANTIFCRYEDLRADTSGELCRIVRSLSGKELTAEEAEAIAEKFSFANQAGRAPGQEQKASFLRKGLVGDWRNHFNASAREMFDRYAGEELILLGYERDHRWVDVSPGDDRPGR